MLIADRRMIRFPPPRTGFLAVDFGRSLVTEAVIAPALLPRQPCILLVPLGLLGPLFFHQPEHLAYPVLALLLLKLHLINPRLHTYQSVDQRRLAAKLRRIVPVPRIGRCRQKFNRTLQ